MTGPACRRCPCDCDNIPRRSWPARDRIDRSIRRRLQVGFPDSGWPLLRSPRQSEGCTAGHSAGSCSPSRSGPGRVCPDPLTGPTTPGRSHDPLHEFRCLFKLRAGLRAAAGGLYYSDFCAAHSSDAPDSGARPSRAFRMFFFWCISSRRRTCGLPSWDSGHHGRRHHPKLGLDTDFVRECAEAFRTGGGRRPKVGPPELCLRHSDFGLERSSVDCRS